MWTQNTIPIISSFQTNNVMIKFQYKSCFGGNNVYIDNLTFSETVGVDQINKSVTNLNIYPNPTTATATITYHLMTDATTEIVVFDILGKRAVVQSPVSQSAGDHSVSFSKNDHQLNTGIYFVQLRVGNNTITQKLMIAE
jgi:hypothetical protein